MGAGQRRAIVGRIGVERVFHHVMAGDADRMDEQLAGERRQAEPVLDLAAVDREAARPRWQFLLPGCQHGAGGIEQAQPQPNLGGAVASPVVGRHQPGGKPIGFAEKGKVGGEVQLVEIAASVAEHSIRQAGFVQSDHSGAGWQQASDSLGDPSAIERGDQHGANSVGLSTRSMDVRPFPRGAARPAIRHGRRGYRSRWDTGQSTHRRYRPDRIERPAPRIRA